MRSLPLLCLLTIGIGFSACQKSAESFKNVSGSTDASAPQTEAPPPPPAPSGDAKTADAKNNASGFELKLIKTGTLEFETPDLRSTYQRVRQAAQANSGFLSNEFTSNEYDRIVQSITIRVPSRNFDALVAAVSKGVDRFDTKTIQATDVTEEFVDAEARLKTKKQVELRYQDLLKRANKISEILEIEKQIGELRAEIESIEGRLRYLSNRVDFSTLDIRFYKLMPIKTERVSGGRFGNALRNGWEGLLSFIIGLASIWPFLIFLGLGGFFFLRYWRKK